MWRRRMVIGIVVLLIGASMVSTRRTSAHNIDQEKAWEMARDYARLVRKQSNGKYLHYSTKCAKAFPGHNHVLRCTVDYQNESDARKGIYTCRETIELFHYSHKDHGASFNIYGNHSSASECGAIRLKQTAMWEFAQQLGK